MKIYIDFDDVICESAKAFTRIAFDLFGVDLPYSQFQFFNMKQTFDLDDDQYAELMTVGHLPQNLLAFEESPGASAVINSWIDAGHDVAVFTGRPFDAYEPSRQWLDNHGLERLPLFCVDKYGRENPVPGFTFSMTLETFYGLDFDFIVEDSPLAFEHVMKFEKCTAAIFNRPWNINETLPDDRFVRCEGWWEISTLFDDLVSKKMNTKELIEKANSFYYGEGEELNLEKAVALYKEAAELGDFEGMCLYGYCLRKGIGTEADPTEAFKLFVKSAEGGFPMGQYNLAFCFENGIGVEKDIALAQSWYDQAEENGYIE